MRTLSFLLAFSIAVKFTHAQQVIQQTTTTVTTYTSAPQIIYNQNSWLQPPVNFYPQEPFFPQGNNFVNFTMDPFNDPFLNWPLDDCPSDYLHFPQVNQPVINVVNTEQFFPNPNMIAPNVNGFNFMLQSIANQSFEQNRLQVAQQILQSNYLTSQQVFSILQLFSFEQSKLLFAKSAFNRVIDPQNYFIVNNAFSFSNSVNELNNFLRGF
jgi:hypothetical protein